MYQINADWFKSLTGGPNDRVRFAALVPLFYYESMRIAPPPPPLGRAFGSLRAPAFRWWFASQVLSASGTMTQGVAQSWLVLKLTGSGLDLGLLGSCYMLPVLVGGPWAGALADRIDQGQYSLGEALSIAEAILYQSPQQLLGMTPRQAKAKLRPTGGSAQGQNPRV